MSSLFYLASTADPGAWDQIVRFWSFQDPSVRTAFAGILLLGLSCGTLGSFVVLRRMSLLGDSLGHAVLPGVCLGFLVTKTKDMRWIFLGAMLSALLGSWLISLIQRRTRLKPDTAMGLVLSGFFGLGTVLLTRLQNFAYGNQSGLNQFLFGQASAIDERQLWWMGVLSTIIVGSVCLSFKELAVTSFDEGFATSLGLPTRAIHYLLMGLVALAIVISIQAVGVVLLSAMLITPAATAYLLTDRLKTMVGLSVLFGTVAGVVGLNISFLGRSLPTGPFIVVVLTLFFATAYLFSPRYGVVTRAIRNRRRVGRAAWENDLKSIFQALEERSSISAPATEERISGTGKRPLPTISLVQLSEYRGEPLSMTRRIVKRLERRNLVEKFDGDRVGLSTRGVDRARQLDRNYKLWEQFLTHEVNLPLDHTTRDAENIEHILGPDLVRELESKYQSDDNRPPAT